MGFLREKYCRSVVKMPEASRRYYLMKHLMRLYSTESVADKMNVPRFFVIILLVLFISVATLSIFSAGDENVIVTVVYTGEKEDFSFLDSSFRGLYRAQDEFGFDIREIHLLKEPDSDPVPDAGGVPSELVLILGGMMSGYAEEVQKQHPDARLILIDAEPDINMDIRSVSFEMSGASYLAGILAAEQTQTGIIGVIGAEDAPVIHSYTDGFIAGVYQDRPDIRVLTSYLADDAAGYAIPEKASLATLKMYEEGADLAFVVAGGSGIGAIRAAEELPGMHIIGVDTDQSFLSPDTVVASVVKNLDEIVYREIADVFRGSYTPSAVRTGLEEGGASVAINPKFSSLASLIEGRYDEAIAMEEGYSHDKQ